MGEMAELMLSGVLCESCGAVVDTEETGYPRSCEDCEN